MAKDKKKDKTKKAAKQEIAAGSQEVATTAAEKPKSKKEKKIDKAVAEQKKEKAARADQLQANNEEMAKTSPAKPKSELRPKGVNTSNLPEHAIKHRIECKSTLSSDVLYIDLSDVTGTSTCLYVDDIHAAVPTVLEQVYWVNMHGERWPLGRITKEDYEFIHKWCKGRLPDDNHVFSVIDCAVNPTLSYGWKLKELKGQPFPTLDLILEADKEFKSNPTYIHNRNPKFIVRENMPVEDSTPKALAADEEDWSDDDDDFIMDDDSNEESNDDEEKEEFND